MALKLYTTILLTQRAKPGEADVSTHDEIPASITTPFRLFLNAVEPASVPVEPSDAANSEVMSSTALEAATSSESSEDNSESDAPESEA